jgi:cysteinyl-tRNA synthetase
MHAAWLYLEGEKISKSAGRAPSLDDLAALGVEPAAFRYYLSTAHYRAPLSLELEAVRAARTAWARLARFVEEAGRAGEGADALADARSPRHPRVRATEDEVDQALADDLDAPRAVAALWKLQRDAEVPAAERARAIGRLAGVLGLDLDLAAHGYPAAEAEGDEAARVVEALVAEREAARARGDYARADALRRALADRGVRLEDTRGGVRRARRPP